jgi:ornithine decarboxylase
MNTVKSIANAVVDVNPTKKLKPPTRKSKKISGYETELKSSDSGSSTMKNLEKFLQEELLHRYGVSIPLIEEPLEASEWAKRIIGENKAESVFTGVDLGKLIYQARLWKRYLPRVQPFYAVKSNPDLNILRSLYILGVNFDCASKGEIQSILDIGAEPSQIIYANPAKGFDHIIYAREKDVRLMTFDNLFELQKILQHFPNAELSLGYLLMIPCRFCPLAINLEPEKMMPLP